MAGKFERKKRSGPGLLCALIVFAAMICLAVMGFSAHDDMQPEQIALRLHEEMLITVTEPEQMQELKELLAGAEDIGYEPKTFILGPELVYIGGDGQETVLELDMDSDLFRYDSRFFDYGPGNDNNALTKLLNLLGLEDWPEKVKDAYPEWFASPGEQTVPTKGSYRQQTVYMDLWYPDWSYVKIREEYALVILDGLRQENPVQMNREKVAVEDSAFTIHIAYDDGREYDLACIGEDTFLLWEGGKETVYGFTSIAFRDTAQEMIARSKESAQ